MARDLPLPVDLAMRLLELGYDVEALESGKVRFIGRFEDTEEE